MRGTIVRGSLSGGLEAKLAAQESVESVRVGSFVVIEGEQHKFFSMVTDVRLDAMNPQVLLDPTGVEDDLAREILTGTSIFGTVSIQPMLMLKKDETAIADGPRPVKTIPAHFSPVREALEEDVYQVFGRPDQTHFYLGMPLDMDIPVCLNLKRFVERSNGIFGKSGTGKTFLTRLVLAGLIRSRQAVNLVFDMHNEYGWEAKKEDEFGEKKVKGLKQLFGSQVVVFTLDQESATRRGFTSDFVVEIPLSQIEVEDIALLQDELKLNNTAVEVAYQLVRRFGEERWLSEFLRWDGTNVDEYAQDVGAHPQALAALYRKLNLLRQLTFIKEKVSQDAVEEILKYLERGINVILEFGLQNKLLTYMLVANILTRRIHRRYMEKSERYLFTGKDQPQPLMITIEEAHKFLNPATARQTIFGTIAREMRKYNVTLLIVDQRPSGIDPEVLSQVGTRVTCLLNDEHDINAVLTGVSNAASLRSVLASLDSKQQALILGHAVPMPVVIRSRNYDEEFYREVGVPDTSSEASFERLVDELYGEG